ncbi:hypothetical protein E4U33_004343 [Claviceps sp. LM78 group G4]|nr:hypothetical protein E4U33_004343 [Claviceps sp. LM78 group G4]
MMPGTTTYNQRAPSSKASNTAQQKQKQKRPIPQILVSVQRDARTGCMGLGKKTRRRTPNAQIAKKNFDLVSLVSIVDKISIELLLGQGNLALYHGISRHRNSLLQHICDEKIKSQKYAGSCQSAISSARLGMGD